MAYIDTRRANPLAGHTVDEVAELVATGTVDPAYFAAWIKQRDVNRRQRDERKRKVQASRKRRGVDEDAIPVRPRKRRRARVSRDWPIPSSATSLDEVRAAAADDSRAVIDPIDSSPRRK